jgi:hypothetical protein
MKVIRIRHTAVFRQCAEIREKKRTLGGCMTLNRKRYQELSCIHTPCHHYGAQIERKAKNKQTSANQPSRARSLSHGLPFLVYTESSKRQSHAKKKKKKKIAG